MIRLNLIVEGHTEQAFANKSLMAHLAEFNVMLNGSRLIRKKRNDESPGGHVDYDHLKRDITNWLKEDKGPEARFSTMIDLYRLPQNFPGYMDAKKESDPVRRVQSLENNLCEDIGDRRFVPYIQLHEFEAMLLAMPDKILTYYDGRKKEVAELNKLVAEFESPELVNDGENTAPSKRIVSLIPDYEYAKHTAGPEIAAAIGLQAIRQKCPHFDQWVRRLEELGQNPL
jgi:hypothetical protein